MEDFNLTGRPRHTHTPRSVGGQNICTQCHAVVIDPITSTDDPRLKNTAPVKESVPYPNDDELARQSLMRVYREAMAQGDVPLDFLLLDMFEEPPGYIAALGKRYNSDPPHVYALWGDE